MSVIRADTFQDANGGNTATINGATPTIYNTVGKNALINGDFQIWQEGTSFASIANGVYPCEMWRYTKVGAMVHTVSQSSDVPTIAEAGRKIPYSILVDCTTVDAAIAASDQCYLVNFVEGYNFVNIAGVGLCLQFWHKHTKTGTYCVGVRNSGPDRSFVREYTQAVSDTWEFASVLIDASPSAGTWDYTNGVGIAVIFSIAAGTDFQTTANAWQTAGNTFATANQVNACDNTANNFRLAGVQLEQGSVATEFEARRFDDELAACQRYWEKSYAYGTSPGTATGLGMMYQLQSGIANNSTAYTTAFFRVSKRAAPTITIYSPANGAAGNLYDYSAVVNRAALTAHVSENSFAGGGATIAAGVNWGYQWVANIRF
jgi:hypothetical protein